MPSTWFPNSLSHACAWMSPLVCGRWYPEGPRPRKHIFSPTFAIFRLLTGFHLTLNPFVPLLPRPCLWHLQQRGPRTAGDAKPAGLQEMMPEAAAAAARGVRGSAWRRSLWLGAAGAGASLLRFPGPQAAGEVWVRGVLPRAERFWMRVPLRRQVRPAGLPLRVWGWGSGDYCLSGPFAGDLRNLIPSLLEENELK